MRKWRGESDGSRVVSRRGGGKTECMEGGKVSSREGEKGELMGVSLAGNEYEAPTACSSASALQCSSALALPLLLHSVRRKRLRDDCFRRRSLVPSPPPPRLPPRRAVVVDAPCHSR